MNTLVILLCFTVSIISINCDNSEVYWASFRWLPQDQVAQNLHRLTPLGNETGIAFYVCRAKYRGHYYPGKFHAPASGYQCLIPADTRERDMPNYEVLYTPAGTVQWTSGQGIIPENSLAAGTDANTGLYTYLARVTYNGRTILGRVLKDERTYCYVPLFGDELMFTTCDVLTLTRAGKNLVTSIATI